jgi:predicted TIM-barrel fold metal-dependent hydrolase
MQKFVNFLLYAGILSSISIAGYTQTYDQLKVQLQFENFYGSKFRSTIMSEEVTGSEFLLDDWLPVEVNLPNGSVSFEKGKVNLYTSTIEVVYKQQEKFISPEHLKLVSLPTTGRWFIPGSKHQFKGISMLGFLEVFEPSPEPPFILVHHYVYIREPNSDGYANAGNLTKKFIKASNTYLYDGTQLFMIKGRKDVEKFYSDDKREFAKLSQELGTNFREPKSIQKLVEGMRPYHGSL